MNFYNKVYLAPMAGATDSSMRKLCHALGSDASISEMVSAKAMCYRDRKTGLIAEIKEGEGPVGIQLFGHEPDVMAEAAVMIADETFEGCSFAARPAFIDINMGCPVKKIVTSGDGSALMNDPALASKIVSACVKALEKKNIPVTVKIRSGWDKNSVNAPYFAEMLEAAGASAIAIHGRTREQMYASFADLSVIEAVKKAVKSIPIIGNGDIKCADDAFEMQRKTGCDSVMIGRAALGNPWIFSEISRRREGKIFFAPRIDETVETALLLVKDIIEQKGEYVGVREARGRVAHFIKGLPKSSSVRDRINRAQNYNEIENVLLSLI